MPPIRRIFNRRLLTSIGTPFSRATTTKSVTYASEHKHHSVKESFSRFVSKKLTKNKEPSVLPSPLHYNLFDSLKKNKFSNKEFQRCFRHFDSHKQGSWTRTDFQTFINALFSNKKQPHPISSDLINKYFRETDYKQDNRIDFDEFLQAWEKTIKYAVKPVSALVIIDVQNDFISGTLALHTCPSKHRGEEVVPVINELIRNVDFDVIVYSHDWHPSNHVSFYENRHLRKIAPESRISADKANRFDTVTFIGKSDRAMRIEQILWPAHCIQKTVGSALHDDLIRVDNALHIYKGTNPEIDSYSAFWDNLKLNKTDLDDQLKQRFVTDVYVVGLATDACVGSTAMHAIENNYRTILVEDACRGINIEDIEKKKMELNKNGAIVVDSSAVREMVSGKNRRPEIARGMFLENLESTSTSHNLLFVNKHA